MPKLLIVAEKPTVAKDIAVAIGGFAKNDRWLESDTAVVSCAIGHLVEVFTPDAAKSGRDLLSLPVIPAQFELRVLERTADQFRLLAQLMKRSDINTIVNACDAGREGELIFRLIYEHAGCSKPIRRMWLQSMTADAIRDAYRHLRPGQDFDGLASAARSRTEADWLIGINGSRGITRLKERQTAAAASMSVGRVQTPTLGIVVDRENAIRTFVPRDFWEVHGTFKVAAGTYVGKWLDPKAKDEGSESPPERLWYLSRAQAIATKCSGKNPTDVTEESKPSLTHAPRLYDLTSLQREANTKFKLSAKRTLDIAQALYEKHKVTTYPRTDSSALPEDYVPNAIGTLKDLAGTQYESYAQKALDNGWVRPNKRIFDNSKISDHFAIIPTGRKPEGLSAEEAKVYDLIVKRFVAAFFPPAEYTATTRITTVEGEVFKSTGRVLVNQGWREVYGGSLKEEDKEKTPALTVFRAGELVTTEKIEIKNLQTKAPVRFTEATLLAAMENAGRQVDDEDLRDAMKERGLGTPATRAPIIEGLLADTDGAGAPKEPYMTRKGSELVPTQKAMDLIEFLRSNGLEYLTSPRMTGEWEFKLLQMEKGGYQRHSFMGEIEQLTRQVIDVIKLKAAEYKLPTTNARCPACSNELEVGVRVVECKSKCGFLLYRSVAGRSLSMAEVESLLADRALPVMDGFVSRAKKRFSAGLKLNDEHKVEFSFDNTAVTADAAGNEVHCPRCQGSMRRIKGAKGYFWACLDRENCNATLDDRDGFPGELPKTRPCPKCQRPMFLRTSQRGPFWGCSGYKTQECNNIVEAEPGEEPPPPRTGGKRAPARKSTGAKSSAGKSSAGNRAAASSSAKNPFL